MPPRYAYWTILVDDAPTAFRSGSKEELLPTFNRLKEKHASAVMKWWQNGKLWDSRLDAQEAMRARGEIGRRNDSRQSDRPSRPSFRDRSSRPQDRKTSRPWSDRPPRAESREAKAEARAESGKLDWKQKGEFVPAPKRADRAERSDPSGSKLDWKPKGEFTPAEKRERKSEPRQSADRERAPEWRPRSNDKPEWTPKASRPSAFAKAPADRRDLKTSRAEKPEWKPKGSFEPQPRRPRADKPYSENPEWKPKGSRSGEKPEWRPKSQGSEPRRSAKREGGLDWTPKSGYTDKASRPQDLKGDKRKWIPKAEYKKSLGIEPKKDAKWRPGGEHRDPKQKYKDAKKAKWTQFKQTIRKRWEAKGGKRDK